MGPPLHAERRIICGLAFVTAEQRRLILEFDWIAVRA